MRALADGTVGMETNGAAPAVERTKRHRWLFLVAVIPAACLGFSNLILLPLWTEAMAAGIGASPQMLLMVGSVELLAAGVASLCVGMFGLGRPTSTLLKAGLATICFANVALSLALWKGAGGLAVTGLLRLLAGLGEGVAMSAALARIGRSPDPDRFFLLNQFVIGLFAMLTFSILPPLMGMAAHFGPASMAIFALLAGMALCGLPLARLADVGDHRPDDAAPTASTSIGRHAWLGIGMVFCFVTGFTTIYASWGRLGAHVGLDVDRLSASLAQGALVGLAGLGAMTLAARRIGLFPPMVICLVLLVASAFVSTHASLLPTGFRQAAIQVAICTEQVGSLIMSPLLMTVLALCDPTKRAVAIAPLATMSASIAGAMLAALVDRHAGPFAIGWAASLLYGCGLVLLALTWRRSPATPVRGNRPQAI